MSVTIEFEIEAGLLEQLDATAAELGVSQTKFIAMAIDRALHRYQWAALLARDEAGYRAMPANDDEIEVWQSVQDWGDPWDESVCLSPFPATISANP